MSNGIKLNLNLLNNNIQMNLINSFFLLQVLKIMELYLGLVRYGLNVLQEHIQIQKNNCLKMGKKQKYNLMNKFNLCLVYKHLMKVVNINLNGVCVIRMKILEVQNVLDLNIQYNQVSQILNNKFKINLIKLLMIYLNLLIQVKIKQLNLYKIILEKQEQIQNKQILILQNKNLQIYFLTNKMIKMKMKTMIKIQTCNKTHFIQNLLNKKNTFIIELLNKQYIIYILIIYKLQIKFKLLNVQIFFLKKININF